jgi:hypothetical protein
MRRTLCLLGATFATLAAAGPATAITNGEPDGDRHPYVGLVTDGTYTCSGALISPTVFVTAAHCFDVAGQEVSVTVDSGGKVDDSMFVSGTWFPDPQFCGGCRSGLIGFDTHDVAVVELDSPIGVSRYASLPATEDLVGTFAARQRLEIVGYGVQDFDTGGGPPEPNSNLSRYAAEVDVLDAGRSLAAEFIKISANPSQAKGGMCFGDSGGPVLRGDTIVAVNAFVTNGLCRGVTFAYRLDTTDALNFIARR